MKFSCNIFFLLFLFTASCSNKNTISLKSALCDEIEFDSYEINSWIIQKNQTDKIFIIYIDRIDSLQPILENSISYSNSLLVNAVLGAVGWDVQYFETINSCYPDLILDSISRQILKNKYFQSQLLLNNKALEYSFLLQNNDSIKLDIRRLKGIFWKLPLNKKGHSSADYKLDMNKYGKNYFYRLKELIKSYDLSEKDKEKKIQLENNDLY